MISPRKLMRAGGAGPVTTATVVRQSDFLSTSALTTYSTTMGIGTANAERYVVVCFNAYKDSATTMTVSSISINSTSCLRVSASQVYGFSAACGIAVLKVPTGTTATVSATVSAAGTAAGIVAFSVIGNIASAIPAATASSPSGAPSSSPIDVSLAWSGQGAAIITTLSGYGSGGVPNPTAGYTKFDNGSGGYSFSVGHKGSAVSGTSETLAWTLTAGNWGLASCACSVALK